MKKQEEKLLYFFECYFFNLIVDGVFNENF